MTPTVLVLVAYLLSAPPRPVAGDYSPDPEVWNGLGYLQTTASEAHVELSLDDAIDLASLEPSDVLVLVYPLATLPSDDLTAFVEAGGFLIVADDHGTSPPLLSAFGIQRRDAGPARHLALWEGREGFLRVRPAGEHFLFFNLEEVVTNFPAALELADARPALTPILSFEGGRDHLIVEASRGDGKLIALADPSLLINDMLRRFYGNKQLAANLLRYLCQREPCRVRVALPSTRYSGRFDRERARLGSLPKQIAAAIADVNAALAELSQRLAEPPFADPLLALPAVLLASLIVAHSRRKHPSRRPPRPPQPDAPALTEAHGLLLGHRDADFSAHALALTHSALELARRARVTPDLSQAGHAAHQRIAAEHAGLSADPPPRWTADRLKRLHADVQTLRRAIAARHTAP
jgi:hypothetical protein